MHKIEIDLDDVEYAQLREFARLNNVSIEDAGSEILASNLSESVNKALDDMLFDPQLTTDKRFQ